MQTDVGGAVDSLAAIASYIYAARYGYSDTVIHNDNQLRLFPREGESQSPLQSQLWTLPAGRGVEFRDRFGNRVQRVRVTEQHTSLVVATTGQVRLSNEPPQADDAALRDVRDLPEAFEFTSMSPLVNPESVSGIADSVAGGRDSLLDVVREVIGWVYAHVRYMRGSTPPAPAPPPSRSLR